MVQGFGFRVCRAPPAGGPLAPGSWIPGPGGWRGVQAGWLLIFVILGAIFGPQPRARPPGPRASRAKGPPGQGPPEPRVPGQQGPFGLRARALRAKGPDQGPPGSRAPQAKGPQTKVLLPNPLGPRAPHPPPAQGPRTKGPPAPGQAFRAKGPGPSRPAKGVSGQGPPAAKGPPGPLGPAGPSFWKGPQQGPKTHPKQRGPQLKALGPRAPHTNTLAGNRTSPQQAPRATKRLQKLQKAH